MSFSKFSVQHFISLFQWICSPSPITSTVFTAFHHKTLFILFTKEKEKKKYETVGDKNAWVFVCATTSNIAVALVQNIREGISGLSFGHGFM